MRIKICLNYLPPSHNRIMGAHWTVLYQEKRRATLALRDALESPWSCELCGLEIGTITASNFFRTALSTLESYRVTTGKHSKVKSSPSKQTGKKTKKRQ